MRLSALREASDLGEAGVIHRLASGFGMQIFAFVVLTLGQLLVVPVCLATWGAALYGDWLVLSAATSLLSFADFGVQSHISNTLRLAWARGETAAGQRALQTGLALCLALTALLLVALAALLWTVDVPALLRVTATPDASSVLAWLSITNILLLSREQITSIYSANNRFDLQVRQFLIMQIGQSVALISGITAGFTPLQAAHIFCAVSLFFGWGVLLIDIRCRYPVVHLLPHWPTRSELRDITAAAPFYAIQLNGGALLVHMPVLLLGRLSTPTAVVAFTTMRTFVGPVRQIANQMGTVIGLELARYYALGNLAAATRLYRSTSVLTGGAVGLLAGLTMVIGPAFFTFWTHGAVRFDPVLAGLFLISSLLTAPTYGSYSLLRLIDRPKLVAIALSAQLFASFVLCLTLIAPMGASGAGAAIGAAEILTFGPYLLGAVAKILGCSVSSLVTRSYLTILVCCALGGGLTWAESYLVPISTLWSMLGFILLWSISVVIPAGYLLLDQTQHSWLSAQLRQWLNWRGRP